MQEQVNQAPEDMQVYDARNLAFKEVVGGVVHCSEPMRGLVPPRAIIRQFQDAATREVLAKAELAQKAAEEAAKKAIEEARDAQERLRIVEEGRKDDKEHLARMQAQINALLLSRQDLNMSQPFTTLLTQFDPERPFERSA